MPPSSWVCGRGRGPSAESWSGGGRAGTRWPTSCVTPPTRASTPTAGARWTPNGGGRGRPCTGRVRLERGNWRVFLPGVGPSYISVGQYERNLERMNANRARAESLGAVRDGPALLAGLVVCGRCGARMTVHYQHGPAGRLQPVYACDRDNIDHAGPRCQRLAGACVDTAVTELLLAALAPGALGVSRAAAEQVEAGRAQVDRIWRARLERAEFTADRARR